MNWPWRCLTTIPGVRHGVPERLFGPWRNIDIDKVTTAIAAFEETLVTPRFAVRPLAEGR